MRPIFLFISVSFFFLISSCENKRIAPVIEDINTEDNEVFTNYYLSDLLDAKKHMVNAGSAFHHVYMEILSNADSLLDELPLSVIGKSILPPSGDKHDYLSYGPYWWPDPKKKDGLPWIRRDGEVNPITRGKNVDKTKKNKVFDAIITLSEAYFISDDKRYLSKAEVFIDGWFVNAETRMNPNLNYAQGIPGINDGRCFGIIEFNKLISVIGAVEMLEYKGRMNKETSIGFRQWVKEYHNWLLTSELGKEEGTRLNNHATWYDYQVVGIYIFMNMKDEAKNYLSSITRPRIAGHFAKNGSQPHELERTKTLSYSTMNLWGWTKLAYYGEKIGVDLWNHQTSDGASIRKGYNFLYPYITRQKEWNLQQISDIDQALKKLTRNFVMAGGIFDVDEFCELEKMVTTSNLDQVVYGCNRP